MKPLLPKAKRSKRHRAAPYRDVPGIVRALNAKHKMADTTVNLAAEYIILTAVRTGEARFMRIREVDFAERLWTVPAERMKAEDDPEGGMTKRDPWRGVGRCGRWIWPFIGWRHRTSSHSIHALAVQRPNESNPLGFCCDIVKPVFSDWTQL